MTRRVTGKEQTHTGYTARHERLLRKHARPGATFDGPQVIGQIDLLTQPAFGLATGGIVNSTTIPLFNKGFGFVGARGYGVGPIPSRYSPGSAPRLIIDVWDTANYEPLAFVSWTIVDASYTNGVQLYSSTISLSDLTDAQFSAHTQVGSGISTADNQTITIPSGTASYFIFFQYNTAS